MVLNRNPKNYFAEVEQMSFEPSNMPPGIETSPDKMLQVCLCVCVCVYVFWWKGVLGEVAWYLPFAHTQHYRLHMISTIRTCARIYDFGSCTAKFVSASLLHGSNCQFLFPDWAFCAFHRQTGPLSRYLQCKK